MPIFHDLVKVFVTQELIVLREFTDKFRCALIDGTEAEPATGVFEQFPNYWQDMSKRIIEHVRFTRILYDDVAKIFDDHFIIIIVLHSH